MHVHVHRLHPAHEGGRIARERGFADAVHDHAVLVSLGRQAAAASRQHVHLDAGCHEMLGQLAHVATEAALDHRRVLPGDQQDTHRRAGTLSGTGAS